MTFSVTDNFKRRFKRVPQHIQKQVKVKLLFWQENPRHPSLHFKRIKEAYWSLRITRSYRLLGERDGDHVIWDWIGSHAEYDQRLSRL